MESPLAEIQMARAKTVAMQTAEIVLTMLPTWSRAEDPPELGRLGAVALRLWRRRLARTGIPRGRGVFDLALRRYALNFGEYSTIYEAGREWGGRPGKP